MSEARLPAEIFGWWLGGNPAPVYGTDGELIGALDLRFRESPHLGACLRAAAPAEVSLAPARTPSIDDCFDTADFEVIPVSGGRYAYRALAEDDSLLDRVSRFVPLISAEIPAPVIFLAIDAERRKRSAFMLLSLLGRLGEQLGVLPAQVVN